MPRTPLTPEKRAERTRKQKEYWAAYKAANPERIAALEKARLDRYRDKHREELRERGRKRYAERKVEINAHRAAHRKLNPEKYRAIDRKHRTTKRKPYLEKRRAWKEANKEKLRVQALAYYYKNHAKSKATLRRSARKHAEKRRAYSRKWTKDHPEVNRARVNARRAFKAGAPIGEQKVIVRWEKAWKAKRSVTCFWYKKRVSPKRCQTDHIIPIAPPQRGAHAIHNLCVSCQPCNSSKNARTLTDWNEELKEPVLL